MLVDAVHMIALREWQGGNQNVDGRVMRTSLTVLCQELNFGSRPLPLEMTRWRAREKAHPQ